MLRHGSQGDAVEELQQQLAQAGYEVEVDGEFSDATEEAVRTLQGEAGITADGIYGPATARALAEKVRAISADEQNAELLAEDE
jgi:N-acetylmuramoyl-L-alanine amidase